MFWVGRIHTGKANYDHTMYKETYVWTWDFYTTLAGCIVRHLAIGVVLVPHLRVLCLPLLSKYLSRIIHCFYFNLELSAISNKLWLKFLLSRFTLQQWVARSLVTTVWRSDVVLVSHLRLWLHRLRRVPSNAGGYSSRGWPVLACQWTLERKSYILE